MSDFLLSAEGSTRGTAYIESGKILAAAGKLHVAWLDAGRGGPEGVRVRTRDLSTGAWSATVDLGMAVDNHGGPALARDREGYLHVLFGPHHHPFSYRRSLRPDDAGAWTPVEQFGEKCTYPSLVCDAGNTLHLACREHGRVTYYRRPAGGSWSSGRPLVRSTVEDGTYRCYRATLALDPAGGLHLGFMLFGGEHFRNAREEGLAGYLFSPDGGDTWTRRDGTEVRELPTDTAFDRIPVTHDCIRASNIAVDPHGVPCLATVSTGFRGYAAKGGGAFLWRHDGTGWVATDLIPFLQQAYPGHRASWIEPSITYGGDGLLYVALTAVDMGQVDPAAAWDDLKGVYKNRSSRIALLVSGDGGKRFEARRVGLDVGGVPSWIPSLERLTGHNEVGVPRLLYTHGDGGDGLNPVDVVSEIRLHDPEQSGN